MVVWDLHTVCLSQRVVDAIEKYIVNSRQRAAYMSTRYHFYTTYGEQVYKKGRPSPLIPRRT